MTGVEIAVVLSAVGAATSAMGAIQQGNAQKAAADRQAQIDERNKILADQDRIRDVQTAQIAAEDKRRENRRQYAALRAAYGSSGIEMAGSPLDVLTDVSTEMALDERRIEDEGLVKNREGALRMLGLQESADSSRAAGRNAKRAGYISAGSTLLSSAGSISGYGAENGLWK